MIFLKMFGKLKAITYKCSLNTKIPPVLTGWLSDIQKQLHTDDPVEK